MRNVIREKLSEAVHGELVELTHRDAQLPQVPRKVHAVIGMRRSGKTYFLHQCLRDRLQAGAPRETLVYFNFEDDRLNGMQTTQLQWVLDEYYLQFPEFRDKQRVTFCLDEIQLVPGWEQFVRRIIDSEMVDVFVSGSSAKSLSREVATALRGRALETIIFPFSFREYLRHVDAEPTKGPSFLTKAKRSVVERAFADYLRTGGFPEAQGVPNQDRIAMLQGYVHLVVLRDVIERYKIPNVIAIRNLTRQLLSAPANLVSVHRLFNDMKSQGIAVSKDSLHAMLAHLEDAFLIRLVPIATSSERQRQSNPRKVYPIDPGLISAFDRSATGNHGYALETAVLIELQRRKYELAYVRTPEGHEVDFLATPPSGKPILIQVCADLTQAETRAREFRAFESARAMYRKLPCLLLTTTSTDAAIGQQEAPAEVTVQAAWEWLLSEEQVPSTTARRSR